MSRSAAHKPATAWAYRKVIALAQALAIENAEDRYEAIEELARLWNVDAGDEWSFVLIHQLAKHALTASDANG